MTHPTVRHRPGLPDDTRAAVTRPSTDCPVEITLAALRGRWTTLLVRELLAAERPLSYRELATALPSLSDKVLTDRLRQLVEAGVAERHRSAGWPPAVHYRLTPRGHALGPVLQSLWDWGAATRA
ncbi:transcriptional regulator, HxlR family [Streptomyces zhaozhouensis]|uniref:Transcriptional regulator, HxlR family n=1 Tax=Streptomyces zhaozhouensis TaxID=1300267 RepID=A0A286DTY5_9ACTN|nr:helix-turn-helix domain-containing protein [Streptomyces zhaozhouensis]SOD62053.1 transcriptional regulator, HxlR family [Streptomyces zhaozhouensis]